MSKMYSILKFEETLPDSVDIQHSVEKLNGYSENFNISSQSVSFPDN